MFEKQRESLEASKNYQRVKAHVVAHKVGYSNAASALAAGAAVALLKSRPTIVNNITQVTPSIAPVMNNISKPVFRPVFNNTANVSGHLTKVVERVDDGQMWKKVKDAATAIAAEQNVPFERAQWLLSRHLNDHLPDVYGTVYKAVAVSTT